MYTIKVLYYIGQLEKFIPDIDIGTIQIKVMQFYSFKFYFQAYSTSY